MSDTKTDKIIQISELDAYQTAAKELKGQFGQVETDDTFSLAMYIKLIDKLKDILLTVNPSTCTGAEFLTAFKKRQILHNRFNINYQELVQTLSTYEDGQTPTQQIEHIFNKIQENYSNHLTLSSNIESARKALQRNCKIFKRLLLVSVVLWGATMLTLDLLFHLPFVSGMFGAYALMGLICIVPFSATLLIHQETAIITAIKLHSLLIDINEKPLEKSSTNTDSTTGVKNTQPQWTYQKARKRMHSEPEIDEERKTLAEKVEACLL